VIKLANFLKHLMRIGKAPQTEKHWDAFIADRTPKLVVDKIS
jgi:hypothetical protein